MNRKIDDEELAKAYNRALALEKAGETDAAASAYAEVLVMDPADHGGAAVRMAALGRGATPKRASEAYVETLFDQQAGAFEDILVDQLGYGVPGLISERLGALGLGPFARMLDLGCGTGLGAEAMREQAAEIIGIDLSENMIDVAEAKDVYEGLYTGDVEAFLADNDEAPFDLLIAADVLPYLGELQPLFGGAAGNLTAGGVFVFSSETLSADEFNGASFKVAPHQRFAHSAIYIGDALADAGFELIEMLEINVRMQDGAPTPGHLVVSRLK